jgi:hypothetical protein
VDTQGNVTATGDVQSNASLLLVGPLFAKKWVVQPSLAGPSLDQNGLDKVTVSLSYEDTANKYASSRTVVFTAPGQGQQWPLELKDPSLRQYSYTVSYELTSGFNKVVGPLTSTDTFLVVSSVPPAS